jgi:hypothetical protein
MLGDPTSPRTSKALLASNAYQNEWDLALEPLGLFDYKTNSSKHRKRLRIHILHAHKYYSSSQQTPYHGMQNRRSYMHSLFTRLLSPPRNQHNTFTLLCEDVIRGTQML